MIRGKVWGLVAAMPRWVAGSNLSADKGLGMGSSEQQWLVQIRGKVWGLVAAMPRWVAGVDGEYRCVRSHRKFCS